VVVIPYQDGIVMEVSFQELTVIHPYLKYSDYIWNKLYVNEFRHRYKYTSAMNFLVVLDIKVRQILARKYTPTARDITKNWEKYYDGKPSPITPNSYIFAFSGELAKLFRGFPIFDESFSTLTTRLKEEKFPSPATFVKMIYGLTGLTTIETINYDFGSMFPKIFVKIDLTEWKKDTSIIVEAFAKDRRTSVGMVEKILGVTQ
jgi:hypothetical protein